MFITNLSIVAQNWKLHMSINRWMFKQNVIYSYTRLLLSNRKKPVADTCNTTDESESYLSERIQTGKTTYCMIPFNWNSRTGKLISSDRKQISDYLGLGVAIGCTAKGQEETCRNVENALYLKCDHNFTALSLHQTLPLIYTLNWCILLSLYLSNSEF